MAQRRAGDRTERPAHPRHRGARPGSAGGRACRLLRARGQVSAREGLCRWPNHLRPGGTGLVRRRSRRQGRRRDDGARLYAALPHLGRGPQQGDAGGSMSETIHLTAAQAMVKWLSVQLTEEGERYIEGVWAIFGHGNVAGIGEALHGIGDALPTWRGQNEQTMAHAAIAYAKTMRRKKAMAVTSSIGPGATNMVTAAALAHVNRLPVLLIPGDVFGNRRPDPVLQQIEDFDDGTVSANDCFRPVARYFDRISRPEHLLTALPRTLGVMTDPQNAGPVVLAFCQDVQAESYDYPADFFAPRTWRIRRPGPDQRDVADVASLIAKASRPVIISGGGVLYSEAEVVLAEFAERHNIPV